LADLGCAEAMPMPFLAPGDLERAGLDGGGLVITNPLAAEESVLRTSLRPGLLRSIAYNESHRLRDVALFEIGRVYAPGHTAGDALPHEHERVSVILAGATRPPRSTYSPSCAAGPERPSRSKASELAGLHPTRSATVVVDGTSWARSARSIRRCSRTTASASERRGSISTWTACSIAPRRSRWYRPVSRFPSSDIDLAFEVDEAVGVDEVESVLGGRRRIAGGLWLFDVFRRPPVAAGRRSLAFTLRLQAADRTLTTMRSQPYGRAASTRCRRSCRRV
jgi:phenylalanyl-tRNA synthetase beta chain